MIRRHIGSSGIWHEKVQVVVLQRVVDLLIVDKQSAIVEVDVARLALYLLARHKLLKLFDLGAIFETFGLLKSDEDVLLKGRVLWVQINRTS